MVIDATVLGHACNCSKKEHAEAKKIIELTKDRENLIVVFCSEIRDEYKARCKTDLTKQWFVQLIRNFGKKIDISKCTVDVTILERHGSQVKMCHM